MAKRPLKDTWAVVMMAGMGTRMKSDVPKVLHKACGQPIAQWVIDSCEKAGLVNRVLVVGHLAEKVMDALPGETFVEQKPQNGTGHAMMVGMEKVPKRAKNVIVLSGDVPCLRPETISAINQVHVKAGMAATVLSFFPPNLPQ